MDNFCVASKHGYASTVDGAISRSFGKLPDEPNGNPQAEGCLPTHGNAVIQLQDLKFKGVPLIERSVEALRVEEPNLTLQLGSTIHPFDGRTAKVSCPAETENAPATGTAKLALPTEVENAPATHFLGKSKKALFGGEEEALPRSRREGQREISEGKHELDKWQHGQNASSSSGDFSVHSQPQEWGYLPRVNATFLAMAPIYMLELEASSASMRLDDEVIVLSSSDSE
ncbi:hypothetical protein R1flu_023465 [Riccia fluitans]|uniref:Uncharacterized protein n=1 Tax=Riccia fluitans TaxID=41844 RepID=A0ABD1XW60_9MARC